MGIIKDISQNLICILPTSQRCFEHVCVMFVVIIINAVVRLRVKSLAQKVLGDRRRDSKRRGFGIVVFRNICPHAAVHIIHAAEILKIRKDGRKIDLFALGDVGNNCADALIVVRNYFEETTHGRLFADGAVEFTADSCGQVFSHIDLFFYRHLSVRGRLSYYRERTGRAKQHGCEKQRSG